MGVSSSVVSIYPSLRSLDPSAFGALASAAESWVNRYLNRHVEAGVYTEVFSGENQPLIFLSNSPILTVNSVTIKGAGGVTTYTVSSNYYDWTLSGTLHIQPQGFWNQLPGWRPGVGNISVNYESAGFAQPVQDLLIGSVMNWFNDQANRSGLVMMEVVGSYTYQMRTDINGVPPSVSVLLNPFKRFTAA